MIADSDQPSDGVCHMSYRYIVYCDHLEWPCNDSDVLHMLTVGHVAVRSVISIYVYVVYVCVCVYMCVCVCTCVCVYVYYMQ